VDAETETTPSIKDSLMDALAAQEGTEPVREEPVSTEDTPEAASDEQTPAEVSATEEQEPPKEVFDAPRHWSEEDRNAFTGLTDDAKKIILGLNKNMESGLNRKMEELAEQRKRYSGLDGFLENFASRYPNVSRDQFDQTVMKVIPDLLSTYEKMARDPVGTLRELADAYNASEKLSEALLSQDNDEGARTKRLKEIELEKENQRLKAEREQSVRNQVAEQLNKFKSETGADGKPLRPYFDELEPVMARLIKADPSLTLDKAYQMAERSEKYEELAKAERERVKAELEAERRKKANDRKVTKPTPGRSSGATTPSGKPKTLRDDIAATWHELETRQ